MAQYSKFLIALAGVVTLFGQSLAGNGIDAAEAGGLVTAGLVAFGVYQARNRPARSNAAKQLDEWAERER
jgi:hypothetical protein